MSFASNDITNETPILYNYESGEGETYLEYLDAIDSDNGSENASVATGSIDENHMLNIRAGKATRPNNKLVEDYEDHFDKKNSERFTEEMEENIHGIDRDVNTLLQKLKKDLYNGFINKQYYDKAKEVVELDSDDLRNEVCETEDTVKEVL